MRGVYLIFYGLTTLLLNCLTCAGVMQHQYRASKTPSYRLPARPVSELLPVSRISALLYPRLQSYLGG